MFRRKLWALLNLPDMEYGIYDPLDVRLINRLCLDFSNLGEQKFRHNFAETLSPLYLCSLETENTENYFLRCQNIFRTMV